MRVGPPRAPPPRPPPRLNAHARLRGGKPPAAALLKRGRAGRACARRRRSGRGAVRTRAVSLAAGVVFG